MILSFGGTSNTNKHQNMCTMCGSRKFRRVCVCGGGGGGVLAPFLSSTYFKGNPQPFVIFQVRIGSESPVTPSGSANVDNEVSNILEEQNICRLTVLPAKSDSTVMFCL